MTTDRGRGGISMVFQSVIGSAVPRQFLRLQTDASAPAAQDAKAAKSQHARRRNAGSTRQRAKNNAELKKLEDAGYKPAANDPNIRRTCRTREKAAGASQAVRRQSHGSIRGLPRASRLRGAHRKQHSGTDEGKRDPGACVICFAFLYVSAHALRTPTQSVPHARRGRISRHLQPILNARTASSFARAEART